MKFSFGILGSTVSAIGLLVACSGVDTEPFAPEAFGSSGGGTGADLGRSGNKNCDPSSGDMKGCACSGTKRACWSVPGAQRNANGCTDGTQTCTGSGEFATWGACTGEVTCGGASSGGSSSGGASSGGASSGGSSSGGAPPPANCECFPNSVRWCDTPIGCEWGQQTCMPDGSWGKCNETPLRPAGCNNPGDATYDQACCLSAGQCCQDYEGLDENKSIGKCDMIACPGGLAN
jgi:hypothetical protein